MLLSVACSVAATNSPGSWQQVTLGKATHWLSILSVDPKRMAMLQTRADSLLLWESLQLVFNCIVSCKWLPSHRRDYCIRAMTGQAWALKLSQQAGSTSPISRIRGAILMYPNEKIEYSDFTVFHSPWKGHLSGTVVLFSIERFSHPRHFLIPNLTWRRRSIWKEDSSPMQILISEPIFLFENSRSHTRWQRYPIHPSSSSRYNPDSVHVIRGASLLWLWKGNYRTQASLYNY